MSQAIFQLNQQVRKEALSFFYASNDIAFELGFGKTFTKPLETFPDALATRVGRVTICNYNPALEKPQKPTYTKNVKSSKHGKRVSKVKFVNYIQYFSHAKYADQVATFALLDRLPKLEHLVLHLHPDFFRTVSLDSPLVSRSFRRMKSVSPANLEQQSIAHLRRLRGLKSVTFQVNVDNDDCDDNVNGLIEYVPTGMLKCDDLLKKICEEICQPRDAEGAM